MNTRDFTRVKYSAGITLRYGNNVINCTAGNLSLRGMYVSTDQPVPVDIPVNVTVYHHNKTALNMNAKVVRKEGNGIGLQIHNMNVNTFVQLRNIVTEYCSDKSVVMQETFKMLKCLY